MLGITKKHARGIEIPEDWTEDDVFQFFIWSIKTLKHAEKQKIEMIVKTNKISGSAFLLLTVEQLVAMGLRFGDVITVKDKLRKIQGKPDMEWAISEAVQAVADPWTGQTHLKIFLRRGELFFVNREASVQKLMDIHSSNHGRSTEGYYGCDDWKLPLVDNMYGIGKTTLANNYVNECRKLISSPRNRFQQDLCNCHTVILVMSKSELVRTKMEEMDEYMLKKLKFKMRTSFSRLPAAFSFEHQRSADFLEDLTQEVGPICLALDEIGAPFVGKNVDQYASRAAFLEFCSCVILDWLRISQLFPIFLGRTDFLSSGAIRPDQQPASPLDIVRVPLDLLRPDKIELIMCETRISEDSDETIKDKFHLDDDDELTQMASNLFQKLNGHPQTLLQAFQRCDTKEELEVFDTILPQKNREMIEKNIYHYKDVVQDFLDSMDEKSPVDLTSPFTQGRKYCTYEYLVSILFIPWENQLESALLYASPCYKEYLRQFGFPFREYIRSIGTKESAGLDHPTVFEYALMKRFQELFSKKASPKLVLGRFLSTPIFGACCDIQFASHHRHIPKVTKAGKAYPPTDLDVATVRPEHCSTIMKLLDRHKPFCFKPQSKSSSSDIILTSDCTYQQRRYRLTVGLAAKNFKRTQLTFATIEHEADLYAQKVSSRRTRGKYLNILFICATNLSQQVKESLNGKLSYCHARKPECIQEVIILDLQNHRKEFFGLEREALLSAVLDSIIDKQEVEG